jgi:hypothetical protein
MATVFLSLLTHSDKPAALANGVQSVRTGNTSSDIHIADPESFCQVPGAPFAYWVSERMRKLFSEYSSLEAEGRTVKQGLATADDFRFARTWWEVSSASILDPMQGPKWRTNLALFRAWCRERTTDGKGWVFFAKGGEYSPFYFDLHLLVNWGQNGKELRDFDGAYIRNESHYFGPGLTWARRSTSGFAPYVLPAGCVFADKGPAVFSSPRLAPAMLGILFSQLYQQLIEISLAAGEETQSGTASRSYEVGLIQRLPFPELSDVAEKLLTSAVLNIVRGLWQSSFSEEPSIWFLKSRVDEANSIGESENRFQREKEASECVLLEQAALVEEETERLVGRGEPILDHRTTADARVLLGFPETTLGREFDRLYERSIHETIRQELNQGGGNRQIAVKSFYVSRDLEVLSQTLKVHPRQIAKTAAERKLLPVGALYKAAESNVSYVFGIAVGRWDVRYATGERPTPKLPDPFDPLPVCSPGMLQGDDGLPLQALPTGYPLRIDWDGILVDDTGHSDDIIRRVRDVFEVIWNNRAEAIEKEACEILGVSELHDYFRKPGLGGFWDNHIKRYSKSRRKAPIYWLLQSSKKNYAIWIYYHRIDKDLLFKALVNYVEPKIRLEEGRLGTFRTQKSADGDTGKEAKQLAREIERQEDFLSELRDFEDKLRRAANLQLEPDLNDGVVLNIAPLHELVPWKEAKKYWEELLEGKYEWSSIGKQLREKGLVK